MVARAVLALIDRGRVAVVTVQVGLTRTATIDLVELALAGGRVEVVRGARVVIDARVLHALSDNRGALQERLEILDLGVERADVRLQGLEARDRAGLRLLELVDLLDEKADIRVRVGTTSTSESGGSDQQGDEHRNELNEFQGISPIASHYLQSAVHPHLVTIVYLRSFSLPQLRALL